MPPRCVISITIVFIAIAGATLSAADIYSSPKSSLEFAQSRESVTHPRQGLKPSRRDEVITSRFGSLRELLGTNKELVVYGAIAFFGILMMGLAIGSASSNSKNKTAAQLALLKQEKEKAENLAKLKSEFLNQVSHELRTPLAVIIGYIECITDGLYGEIEPKHHEILQVVAKQSTHLKNMIDQILIFSRLEAGKQPIRIEEIQLTKVINDLKDTFEFLCRQKGIELCWELTRDPLPIHSDATRLKEVISNLLQNAVKYTDRGSITVRSKKMPTQDSVSVEVKDTGMGISEQHLTNIFEPFMQVHKTSTENSRGGIGLGLSIVKKHLEQMGGTISVESELGKGSIFRIILPRKHDKQKSRTSRLIDFVKRRSLSPNSEHPAITPQTETRERKVANTGHMMG
ncbi:MAG: HAMP domain-containing histidine kinase [Deltaproteobacteria bacterium]|nr:MAG: HAMP domain-containing histidine kinase [Deltaproteobacteria bacterium]